MEWFKVKSGLLDNRKFQTELSDTMKVRLLNLWCLTAKHDGILPPIGDMAFCLRISDGEMLDTIKELKEAEFLDEIEPNVYQPHDWDEHNPPTSTQRSRKHRESKRKDATPDEPPKLQPVPVTRTEPITAEMQAAFDECLALHPNADTDAAARAFITLAGNKEITEADAPKMVPGMKRWLESEAWEQGQGKYSPVYRQFSTWIRERAWLSNPKPSAAAEVAQARQREEYVRAPQGWTLHGGVA